MRRAMHIALALAMSLTMTIPAAAAEVGTAGSGGEVPVTISADATAFSVTVPTSIPLHITTDATVTCANNLSIQNRSAGPVEVSGILVQDSAWSIVSFNGGDRSLLASEKVNSNKLGIAFTPDGGTQTESSDGGTQNITVNSAEWVVSADGSLSFDCDAIATAVSSTISDAIQAANVVFTVKWKDGSTSGSGGSSTEGSGGSGESGSSGEPYLAFSSPSEFDMATQNGEKNWDGTLEYSTDKTTWRVWTGENTIFSNESSDGNYVLYLRGTNNHYITGQPTDYYLNTSRKSWSFYKSDNIACSGNIENLLDYAMVERGEHPTMDPFCFSFLFEDASRLTKVPTLPATTLADGCYRGMFQKCTGLTQAPTLPATNLTDSCYYRMFYGCTGLTQAPTLPATTLANACYKEMFSRCSSLTKAPTLSATNLAVSCYQNMFNYCTSLTTAPALPATQLTEQCYFGMFSRCTGLTQAPTLPATTLTEYCYNSMFDGCTSLTTAPALPATTLAKFCYKSMFTGCTGLTQVPELPATTLVSGCYQAMFEKCTSIKLSATQTEEYTLPYKIAASGTGSANNYVGYMFTGTGGSFATSPTINTTYYLSNTNTIIPAS